MPNRWQLTVLAVIAVVPAIAAFYFEPPKDLLDILRIFSTSITAVTVAVSAFHFGLWRYLPRLIAPKPDINGTWRVEATSWTAEGEKHPFEGYMFVKQDYFTLSMRQETLLTASELEVENFVLSRAGLFDLWAIYRCEARADQPPDAIKPHYGAMRLRFSHNELNGRFWIDGTIETPDGQRVCGGHLRLYDRKPQFFHNYEEAAVAYQKPPVTKANVLPPTPAPAPAPSSVAQS